MKFGHIEIFVQDVARSHAFYRDILEFDDVAVQEDGALVWLMKSDIEILIRRGKPKRSELYQHTNIGIVQYTDDLKSEQKLLEKRGLIFRGTDGSDKCLTFTDPDGHWFQLVNPDDH
ncbi:MAG: VOC family protein [Candidatus Kariarchaeaceae archaeon]|jgi:catechol 2,3-dioxygenase-like lactoylglutathione lyase family enzyme